MEPAASRPRLIEEEIGEVWFDDVDGGRPYIRYENDVPPTGVDIGGVLVITPQVARP